MKQASMVSVIIPFYNRLDFLSLVLLGFTRQSDSNFEIIIAEDNDDPQNSQVISEYRSRFPQLRIKHVSQTDAGFRKTRILNEATRVAGGDLLVFIDGDCIPHRHFIRQHCALVRPRTALAGRRVNLGPQTTDRIVRKRRLPKLTFPYLMFSDSQRVEESLYFSWLPAYFNRPRGLLGCNWSIYKADLLSINGHDEDYQHAGAGEDSDIEWRLRKSGIKISSVKFRAIVYHLYHDVSYGTDDTEVSLNLLAEKKKQGVVFCKNGINPIEVP